MNRREVIEVRRESGSREPSWQPRDLVIAGIFILAGFVLAALLPSWLWSVLSVAGFGAYLAWAARRNRRARPMPPGWVPGSPPPDRN